jgi:hypothetical protein
MSRTAKPDETIRRTRVMPMKNVVAKNPIACIVNHSEVGL